MHLKDYRRRLRRARLRRNTFSNDQEAGADYAGLWAAQFIRTTCALRTRTTDSSALEYDSPFVPCGPLIVWTVSGRMARQFCTSKPASRKPPRLPDGLTDIEPATLRVVSLSKNVPEGGHARN